MVAGSSSPESMIACCASAGDTAQVGNRSAKVTAIPANGEDGGCSWQLLDWRIVCWEYRDLVFQVLMRAKNPLEKDRRLETDRRIGSC